jgi:DNA-binding Lrp family transcriptional regulator
MTIGNDNKQISNELKIPLSTIQRRTKIILKSGIISVKMQPSFKRLGIKKGLLHVYLRNGDIKESALKVSKMDGILSSSVHVGNSDIVADYVYEDSEQLVDTISKIKHMDNVERVLWSEEVYSVPVNMENVLSSLKRMWANDVGAISNKIALKGIRSGTKRLY